METSGYISSRGQSTEAITDTTRRNSNNIWLSMINLRTDRKEEVEKLDLMKCSTILEALWINILVRMLRQILKLCWKCWFCCSHTAITKETASSQKSLSQAESLIFQFNGISCINSQNQLNITSSAARSTWLFSSVSLKIQILCLLLKKRPNRVRLQEKAIGFCKK